MSSLSVKVKFQIGQFKSLEQIFCKFEVNFDLECRGHKFLEQSKTFRLSIHTLSLKVKFLMVQKLLYSQGITQNCLSLKANLTLKVMVKVTSFQTCQRPLCDQYMVQV